MSRKSPESAGFPGPLTSRRAKPTAPKIDISDIQLRRAEKNSTGSDSAWRFLDQPTARSARLRRDPAPPLSADRPAGAARQGRQLCARFSGPRLSAGSPAGTPQRRAPGQADAPLEPSLQRRFSSAAPCRPQPSAREPGSRHAPGPAARPSQPVFDFAALLNDLKSNLETHKN